MILLNMRGVPFLFMDGVLLSTDYSVKGG